MTEPYHQDDQVTVYAGDCLDVLRGMPDNSIDSIVTDPPYSLGFMGRAWDTFGGRAMAEHTRAAQLASGAGWTAKPYGASGKPAAPAAGEMASFQRWCETWATECLRVLKPGGHMLAFGGTRTWHRLACGVEDAGFEIRESTADLTGRDSAGLLWIHGQGFPKSHAIEPAILKEAMPATRAHAHVTGLDGWAAMHEAAPASSTALLDRTWRGFGTATKPAFEPIVVARKPLSGTVAANVLAYGTGALNIDVTRVGTTVETWPSSRGPNTRGSMAGGVMAQTVTGDVPAGRWPPNVVLDETAAAELDRQSGNRPGAVSNGSKTTKGLAGSATFKIHEREQVSGYGDAGGASRFFPVFKNDQEQSCTETQTTDAPTRNANGADSAPKSTTGQTPDSGASTIGPATTNPNPFSEPTEHATDCHYEDEPCSDWCAWEGGRFPQQWRPAEPFPVFKYAAKAPTSERPRVKQDGGGNATQNYGGYKVRCCDTCGVRSMSTGDLSCGHVGFTWTEPLDRQPGHVAHPTVKPLDLMRWLVRLVTPPGGTCLDPFAGSGTTGEACILEHFRCILIEREADYLPLIMARLTKPIAVGFDFEGGAA